MKIVRTRKLKLHSILTTMDRMLPTPLEMQELSLASFIAPKLYVSGPDEPAKRDGLIWIRMEPGSSMRTLLTTYLHKSPGMETVMLTAPNVILGDVTPLLTHVDENRLNPSWGCYAGQSFFMSSSIVEFILSDTLPALNFIEDWQKEIHTWMHRILRHRYFDASTLVTLRRVDNPAEPFSSLPEPEIKPRRLSVRRVKV